MRISGIAHLSRMSTLCSSPLSTWSLTFLQVSDQLPHKYLHAYSEDVGLCCNHNLFSNERLHYQLQD